MTASAFLSKPEAVAVSHSPRSVGEGANAVEPRIALAMKIARGAVWEVELRGPDPGDVRVSYSDEYFQILGVDPATGRDTPHFWLTRVHPDDVASVRAAFDDYALGRTPGYEREYRMRHEDGRWLWALDRSAAVERDARGRPLRVIGFIMDITSRRDAQEALRRSEERFRAVADLAPGFVFEATVDDGGICRLVYTSESFDALMGCSHDEFLARGGWEQFFDDASLRAWNDAGTRMRRGERVKVELHGRTSAGRDTWLLLQTLPMASGGVEPGLTTLGVVHDITDAKDAELSLRDSQVVLQTIAAASPTNLSMFDRHHRLVFANFTLHGAPVEEVVGKTVHEFCEPLYADRICASIDAVVNTGRGMDLESEMLLPGFDAPRTFETHLRPVASNGEVVGVVANISDVSELRAQREHLLLQARIIDTIREGVVLMDREGTVLLANPAMHALFGHASDALVGRSFASLTRHAPDAFRRKFDRVLKDLDAGEAPQLEFEGRKSDGESLAATALFAAIHIRGERRVVAVLNDLTERKRLEREVLQVATREQQRIGSDLHDGLGQELTGIALLLKGLVPRLGQSDSATVKGEVQQIISLVNQAIDSTRSLARGLSPVPAADDGLLLALEALARQTSERHGVRVTVDDQLDENAGLDDGTATHLYRIAQEALGNALRHGQPRSIAVGLRSDASQIELAVTDDGSGFDHRTLPPLGLGLKIMRFRAQMIGGDLVVESASGQGTTIRCHCPASRA